MVLPLDTQSWQYTHYIRGTENVTIIITAMLDLSFQFDLLLELQHITRQLN